VTITAWRLVKWQYRHESFTGDGSYQFGNRWNSPGRRVVYVGDTQALSALESIVHFRKGQTPPSYAFLSAAFAESLVSVLVGSLPSDWPSKPLLTAALGDKWYDSRASCILAVPTALVPHGTNYLINATHPGFSEVKVGPPIPYSFDARIAAMAATPVTTS
jgi:RES domain-containing protein